MIQVHSVILLCLTIIVLVTFSSVGLIENVESRSTESKNTVVNMANKENRKHSIETAMREVSRWNLASYFCWNMHVGNNDWLSCWLSRGQQVSHQRWILGNIHHVCLCQAWKRLPTLALKPRRDVTQSPKQGYQWPHKRTCVQKFKK